MYKRKPVFSKKELSVIDEKKNFWGQTLKLRNIPVSYRENMIAHYTSKEPWFVAANYETVSPTVGGYNKDLSRPFKTDSVDCFGVKWKWVETVGGSITPGGEPVFVDANEWKDKIKMPDINSWNWEEDAKDIPDLRFYNNYTLLNGFWFERLVSLMDFDNAAVALIDPDQKKAVKELFEALTDLAVSIVNKMVEYFPSLDGFCIHDDWGSQRSPFFSDEVAREMFLPYMKELVGHIHSVGRCATIHSCGHVEDRVCIFIEAGLDGWQLQEMNNVRKLYEEFGDKMVFEAWPDDFDPNDEKQAVQAARDFTDFFCKPGKTAILSHVNPAAFASEVFLEELYEYSRKHFLKY